MFSKNIRLGCLKAFMFILVGFVLTAPLVVQAASIKDLLFQDLIDRSPIGRYQNGDRSPGVKRFGHDQRCQEKDLKRFFLLQEPPLNVKLPSDDIVVFGDPDKLKTRDLRIEIEDFETSIQEELEIQLGFFSGAEENPVVSERELCIDAVEFEDGPNAVSIGLGYLVFDPHLFFKLAEEKEANDWSMRAVMAHEFAHQLQFWHNDPTLHRQKEGRRSVRDQELQADCVAAGILAHQASEQGEKAEDISTALIRAFSSIGDFSLHLVEHHHGTAYERAHMVSVGIRKRNEIVAQGPISSQKLLGFCRLYIDGMNLKFGDEIWPIGSSL